PYTTLFRSFHATGIGRPTGYWHRQNTAKKPYRQIVRDGTYRLICFFIRFPTSTGTDRLSLSSNPFTGTACKDRAVRALMLIVLDVVGGCTLGSIKLIALARSGSSREPTGAQGK